MRATTANDSTGPTSGAIRSPADLGPTRGHRRAGSSPDLTAVARGAPVSDATASWSSVR
jgi:hypothetical protein